MDDDDMMYASENEDLAGEDGEGGEDAEDDDDDGAPSVENTYYNAKGLAEDSVSDALDMFAKVVALEGTAKGEWGFKATKKMCKLELARGKLDRAAKHFESFVSYTKVVNSNAAEKGITSLLDLIAATGDLPFMTRLYEAASKALLEAKNPRVWFRVNLKLAQALLDARQHDRLAAVLLDLHRWCEIEPGVDDPKKGSQLVDVYALEIQLQTALGNNKALKSLSNKALGINTAIPHPRVLGVIRECGGMVNMAEHEWFKAKQDFFEAFKSFDEAGSARRIVCLRYLVLASMLDLSTINPFESPETKPYVSDSKVATTLQLYKAYESGDIKRFEKLVAESGADLKDDPFMKKFVPDLIRTYRQHTIAHVLQPYQRVRIGFVSSEIGITDDECESLVVSLILDQKVRGRIDQMNKIILLESDTTDVKYRSLAKWTRQITSLSAAITNKLVS